MRSEALRTGTIHCSTTADTGLDSGGFDDNVVAARGPHALQLQPCPGQQRRKLRLRALSSSGAKRRQHDSVCICGAKALDEAGAWADQAINEKHSVSWDHVVGAACGCCRNCSHGDRQLRVTTSVAASISRRRTAAASNKGAALLAGRSRPESCPQRPQDGS